MSLELGNSEETPDSGGRDGKSRLLSLISDVLSSSDESPTVLSSRELCSPELELASLLGSSFGSTLLLGLRMLSRLSLDSAALLGLSLDLLLGSSLDSLLGLRMLSRLSLDSASLLGLLLGSTLLLGLMTTGGLLETTLSASDASSELSTACGEDVASSTSNRVVERFGAGVLVAPLSLELP
ncbi:hypothetical protein H4S01_001933 [Coemansia sp. RSA 2610]|nr:hypothetical protein IWW54_001476 [Coemansia sp. RSA 2705]KAJ2367835.1 hypothetical protein H4S01_001933 [Coemansia sp. RSA 2610]